MSTAYYTGKALHIHSNTWMVQLEDFPLEQNKAVTFKHKLQKSYNIDEQFTMRYIRT